MAHVKKVIEQGQIRAKYIGDCFGGRRFVLVEGIVYGKLPGKKLDDSDAVLRVIDGVGHPFEAEAGETCAQAVARLIKLQGAPAVVVKAY